jgi:prepilin-type N-terminal cleavage/methylation domain-containing protein
MTTSETGRPSESPQNRGPRDAFTLVELLTVVAIMAIVMSVLGFAIGSMGGSATQVAAAQVASGLSLARQLAVAQNTETRFVIADLQGADGAGLPQESFRYWTVIMTNKRAANPSANTWVMMKEWEKLPQGAVFLNIANRSYNTINEATIGATPGKPFRPQYSMNLPSAQEWLGFGSYGSFQLVLADNRDLVVSRLSNAPTIGFNGTGGTLYCSNSSRGLLPASGRPVAVRVAAGASDQNNQIMLKSTNGYAYVEADSRGRIRVRNPESYRTK